MVELKSLTIWVKCPKYPGHQGVELCFKCDDYIGQSNKAVQCTYEAK